MTVTICLLPVGEELQPCSQPFRFPVHNRDYGVEQDFLRYLVAHPELVAESPAEADWHYLPVYWTRWHLGHDYGRTGKDELARGVAECILDDRKTFTICQYSEGPGVDLGEATVFLSSRPGGEGIDMPLLSTPHRTPIVRPAKRYLASFVGRLSTHAIRTEMAEQLKDREDVFILDGIQRSKFLPVRALEKLVPALPKSETRFFVRKMLESFVALCPRGYGGSSFRFYEAMQLGTVPFLIGEPDTRPFKKSILWKEISLYSPEATGIAEILDAVPRAELLSMGERAHTVWEAELTYQNWCKHVVRELEYLS